MTKCINFDYVPLYCTLYQVRYHIIRTLWGQAACVLLLDVQCSECVNKVSDNVVLKYV